MDENIYITDLIAPEVLQQIQDAFCAMSNIAAGIADLNGVAVTTDSLSTDFCMNYNKKSLIGRARCEQCDKQGGELALEKKRFVSYHCHTGLVDFAAPIMANGKMIGSFIGGQIRTTELDEDRLLEIADEIGVDPQEYLTAAKKIRLVEEEELKRAGEFLYKISNILSNMAYNRYQVLQANKEIERAAQMKSDFLANMSHEIRTPMNAVIGMAQMALREELPSNARTYINQIISSGKTLLTIINDVLDFSKIESGKMDIEETEYEPMSVVNDVSNMIMTRVMDKDVELILDIAPDLPRKLYGDSNRIKQIMINLANNAVKFTKEGQVVLKVGFECIGEEEILLLISVSDTGIGIKKEDMERLFESFQQVDSKRNRNIEGTGLGLAICKKLLELMNGKIWVESEFGKGSTFSVCIPQRVLDTRPSVIIRDNEMILATGLIKNVFVKQQMEKDMKKLRIHYQTLDTEEYLDKAAGAQFLFVEKALYTEKVRHFIEIHPDLDAVMLIDFSDSVRSDYGNLIVIKKPLYVLNLAGIFNHEDISVNADISESVFDFTAPEAQILIVDDNPVNLTVTEGLLKPLEMKIDTAAGGEEAVEMISKKKYDLIFMDHMMPELDGVETTHIIRRFHKEYDSVPIIALTANAVDGVKEMFLNEGMNDFVAKPIEMSRILAKLQKWLPQEKIYKVRNKMAQEETTKMKIEGLNTGRALQFLGSEKLYWSVLKDYYHMIDKKADLIKTLEEKEDWKRYMIEVHALKSISKQIGAEELSKLAAEMEQAGNRGDAGVIHRRTDDMLAFYRSYREILRPYFPEEKESAGEKKMDAEVLRTFFSEMRNAMDELDMDSMDELVKKMKAYRYGGIQEEYFKELRQAAEEFEVDVCEKILEKWEQEIDGILD